MALFKSVFGGKRKRKAKKAVPAGRIDISPLIKSAAKETGHKVIVRTGRVVLGRRLEGKAKAKFRKGTHRQVKKSLRKLLY